MQKILFQKYKIPFKQFCIQKNKACTSTILKRKEGYSYDRFEWIKKKILWRIILNSSLILL